MPANKTIFRHNQKIADLEFDAACSSKNYSSFEIIDTQGEFSGCLNVYIKTPAFLSEFEVILSDDVRMFETMDDACRYISQAMVLRNDFPVIWQNHMDWLETQQEEYNYTNDSMMRIPWKLPAIPQENPKTEYTCTTTK